MPDGRRLLRRGAEELRAGAQAVLHRVGAHRAAWRLGLADEVDFWDRYLGTGGLDWPEEFADRVDPQRELTGPVADLVRDVPYDPVRVLDVGSGPLSAFAGAVPGRAVELVAVDPLADRYAALCARHGVPTHVRPTVARVEALTDVLPLAQFDVVVARNALDHSDDPVRGVTEMLAVTRPGGWLYLEHAEREGQNRRYRGLHHWDLWAEDGRPLVGHGSAGTDLAALDGVAMTHTEVDEAGWVRVWLQRAG
ncbi:MAG TPA: methyltransferase domain-containing protein [Acidimicrobiales bacterium]|nr:methyltransferase domain-containing protein [Acidimicrobiales bacterium]